MSNETEVKPKSKRKLSIILLIVAIIGLLAGTFTYFTLGMKNISPNVSPNIFQANTRKDMKSTTLPSMTVNLAESSKSRYLKTTITLEYSKEVEEELKGSLYKVKDCILKVLRNTTASSLDNPQQTEILKEELLKEINSTLTTGKISGLYFEEFLVQ